MTAGLRCSDPRPGRLAFFALATVLAFVLGGCGSMVSNLPVVGLPDGAPARRETREFMPVHEMPAARDDTMAPTERAKMQSELLAARDRQPAAAAGK